MPKLPSGPKDFGQVTEPLGRSLKLGSYSTAPLGNIAAAKNRATQQLAQGIESLGTGIGKFGASIEAEKEKQKKKKGKGKGGAGTGKDDFSQPIVDPKTGKPFVHPEYPEGLTTDSAYNLSALFKSDENVAVDAVGREVDPRDMKTPGWADGYLSNLVERGQKIRGYVLNSPLISDTDKGLINRSLRDHYYKVRESLLKTRAKNLSAVEKQDSLDRNVKLSPEYGRLDADVEDIWQDEERAEFSNPHLTMADKIENLKTKAVNNTVSYLKARLSYQEQIELLSGPSQEWEPSFMKKLGKDRKLALDAVKKLQADNQAVVLPKIENAESAALNGRNLSEDDANKVLGYAEKNPSPKILEAAGKFKAAYAARQALWDKDPGEQEAFLSRERFRINSEPNTPDGPAYLDALEVIVERNKKVAKEGGAYQLGLETGALARPDIDWSDDNSALAGLRIQADQARKAGRNYPGAPLNFLLDGQHEHIIERYKKGDIGVFRLLNAAFGRDVRGVYRELATKDASVNPFVMANIGQLDANGNSKAAQDILNYMKRKRSGDFKSFIPSGPDNDGSVLKRQEDARAEYGNAFKGQANISIALQMQATAVTEERMASGEYANGYSRKIYRDALQEVAGKIMRGDGKYYGGVVKSDYTNAAGYGKTDSEFRLRIPPNIPHDQGVDWIRQAVPKDFPGGVPVVRTSVSGKDYREMTNQEWKTARLTPNGKGGWHIIFGERNGKPMYWRDRENYQPYSLSLSQVMRAKKAAHDRAVAAKSVTENITGMKNQSKRAMGKEKMQNLWDSKQ